MMGPDGVKESTDYEGSTRTGTRTQDQLIKSQLLYQLSYPRLHSRSRGAAELRGWAELGKMIIEIFHSSALGQLNNTGGSSEKEADVPRSARENHTRTIIFRRRYGLR